MEREPEPLGEKTSASPEIGTEDEISTHAFAARRPPQRTQGERTEQARTAILASATAILARDGIRGLTLNTVGEHAGYSRGIASYHFGSKAGLVAALLDTAVNKLVSVFDDSKAGDENEPVRTVLDALTRMHVTDYESMRVQTALIAHCTGSEDPTLNAGVAQYNRQVCAIFERAALRAGYPADQARLHAVVLLAGIRGITQQWLLDSSFDIDSAFKSLGAAMNLGRQSRTMPH